MKLFLLALVTLFVVGVAKGQVIRCSAEGYFGPTMPGEPCYDANLENEALRCDYISCVFFPAFNIWVKYPYVCPGSPAATFDPATGQCAEPLVTSTTPTI